MKSIVALLALTLPVLAAAQEQAQPAESPSAYQCRVRHTPEVRQCTQRCDFAYQKDGLADQRWQCIQLCTVRGLWAMAECRRDATAPRQAQVPLQAARAQVPRGDGQPQAAAGTPELQQAQASR
jgi:hypothetical protein